jgi:hypothetical protein
MQTIGGQSGILVCRSGMLPLFAVMRQDAALLFHGGRHAEHARSERVY